MYLLSAGGQLGLLHFASLLFRKFSKEIYFVAASWLPLVVCLESALKVRFDVYVERLGLQLGVGRVVNARNRSGRSQVVQV